MNVKLGVRLRSVDEVLLQLGERVSWLGEELDIVRWGDCTYRSCSV
jgi:hypothetical protein